MGIRLLEAGIRNFVILEKDQEVGGTWRDNTYPGAACDVQSHLYSYSFDGKPDWSRRYAGWEEIQRYILDTTERHGMRRYIRFGEQVDSAHFDTTSGRWRIGTKSGLELSARHLVLATGPLHVPQVPGIPGLESFKGKVFHSARWDHGYDLDGKRVASVGTGGSAIQYCPEIAPRVATAARVPAHGRVGDPARPAQLHGGAEAPLRTLPRLEKAAPLAAVLAERVAPRRSAASRAGPRAAVDLAALPRATRSGTRPSCRRSRPTTPSAASVC